MGFLKKIIPVAILFMTINTYAQSNELIAKFSESYKIEKEGKPQKAAETLKSVYSKNQDSYELNLRLGWLYYSAGMFTESMIYYSRAINLKPYSIEAKFGITYPQAAIGKWEAVEKTYIDILKLDAKNTIASYKLGLIYYGRKDYAKASEYFSNVVNLYPFDYDSNLMLAWSYFKLGKSREAQILFKKVLLISPNDSSALEGLSYLK